MELMEGRYFSMSKIGRGSYTIFTSLMIRFQRKNTCGSVRPLLPRDSNVGRTTSHIRERIVDIHGWKLMGNHTHLLISERVENGILLFTRKMSGYARYFNERHKRHGPLLERTKKVHVEDEAHFLYILHYIHLNGLDDFPDARDWRVRDRGDIKNIAGALEHLRADRWSSYRDYCGIQNFPSILTKTLFEGKKGEYKTDLKAYLSDNSGAEGFDLNTLE